MFSKILSRILGQTRQSDVDLSSTWLTRAPKMQRGLLQVSKDFQNLKPPADYSYDMFAAKMALERNKRFEATLGDGRIEDWVGIRIEKRTHPSGDTSLSIMISDLGDSVFVGNSHVDDPIRIDSAMFDVVARTKVRTPVIFSGQLVAGTSGSMHMPDVYEKYSELKGLIFAIRFDHIRLL